MTIRRRPPNLRHPSRTEQRWRATFATESLHIDLSTIGFADFVILGKLLHLIYAATTVGGNITVRLPTGDPIAGDEEYFHADQMARAGASPSIAAALSRRRRQRQQCRSAA